MAPSSTLPPKRVGIVSFITCHETSSPVASDASHRRGAASRRGRPRDHGRDVAIHAATVELLGELGYDRLSLEAIAARAGVSKATIYRRWSGKAEVVATAVDQAAVEGPPPLRGTDLRGDVLAVIEWLARQIAEQDIAIIAAVLAGMRSDPELAAAMRTRLARDESAMLDRSLRRARDRGEPLRPDAERLFSEIAPAAILHRLLITGAPCDRPFLEHLADDVIMPLLRA